MPPRSSRRGAVQPQRLLGRLPRAHDPSVPRLSELLAVRELPAIPDAIDYARDMPSDLGMLLNDKLSDCTCAAYYHARQVWTFHSGAIEKQYDQDAKVLYERACGYDPGDPSSDAGGVEQHVLKYLHRSGAPIRQGRGLDKILGFVEVPVADIDDVKRTIYNSGVAYIGLGMPSYITSSRNVPPKVWDVRAGRQAMEGGHAVVLTGYDDDGATLISWGERYTMTWAFFERYVDEVYAIVDAAWVRSPRFVRDGLASPGGTSLESLSESMRRISE